MAEVPRIVRERLRSQVAAGEHPDANLLSAFSERGLTEQEREQVLDHLSRCPECREVVALSALLPVEEERLVAAAAVGRVSTGASRSWWRSPIVHWSALTAAALVVLIAVGERMRLRQGHSASAPAIARYEPAERQIASAPETAPAPPEQKKSHKPAETARAPRHADTLSASRPAGAMGGGSGGKVAALGGAPASTAAQNAPAAPPPPALPMKPHPNVDASKTDGPAFESASEQAQVKAAPAPSATVGGMVGGAAAAPALKS